MLVSQLGFQLRPDDVFDAEIEVKMYVLSYEVNEIFSRLQGEWSVYRVLKFS